MFFFIFYIYIQLNAWLCPTCHNRVFQALYIKCPMTEHSPDLGGSEHGQSVGKLSVTHQSMKRQLQDVQDMLTEQSVSYHEFMD